MVALARMVRPSEMEAADEATVVRKPTEARLIRKIGEPTVVRNLDDLAVLSARPTEQETSLDALAAFRPAGDESTGARVSTELQARLREEVRRAERGISRFSVVVIEVVDCEACRTLIGHDAAEEVAVEAIEVVRRCLREYDICGRLDRDEVGVILPGVAEQDAAAAAGRLQTALRDGALRARVGWAAWNPQTGSEQSLVARARHARDVAPRTRPPRAGPGRSRTKVWIDGLPCALSAEASRAGSRLQLRLPLAALEQGAPLVVVGPSGYRCIATVADATGDEGQRVALHLDVG